MKQKILALLLFVSTSLMTLALLLVDRDYSLFPRLISGMLILLVLFLLASRINGIKTFMQKDGKWYVLFFLTLMLQLLLLSTGSIFSKFFILFDLFILGISLFFTFPIAVLFILVTLPLFAIAVYFDSALFQLLLNDPVTPTLYILSCISIIPVSYFLADKYHFKSTITDVLQKQLAVEDAILDNLHELVIVTDSSLRILSVNDVVERLLHRSRAELIRQPLFSVLFLKDIHGDLLSLEKLSLPSLLQQNKKKEITDLLLVTTTITPKKVTVQIHPIIDVDGANNQLSIIITEESGYRSGTHFRSDLQIALTKHQAKISLFMKLLGENGEVGLKTKLLLLEKSEQDIISILRLEELFSEEQRVLFDIAKMSKKTLEFEQEFADALHVPLDFSFTNFGKEDIAPIIAGQTTISYDQLTGPFFTVPYDVRLVSILMQKIVTLGILLASSQKNPLVQVSLTKATTNSVILSVSASCSPENALHKADLFKKYYGALAVDSNMTLGSGLEGYLVKTITDQLQIPLEVSFHEQTSQLLFHFTFNKSTGSNP